MALPASPGRIPVGVGSVSPRISTPATVLIPKPTVRVTVSDSNARLLGAFFGPNRRNLAVFETVGGLVVLALLVPHWTIQYGVALTAFSIWMAWSVETRATWLEGDESSTTER